MCVCTRAGSHTRDRRAGCACSSRFSVFLPVLLACSLRLFSSPVLIAFCVSCLFSSPVLVAFLFSSRCASSRRFSVFSLRLFLCSAPLCGASHTHWSGALHTHTHWSLCVASFVGLHTHSLVWGYDHTLIGLCVGLHVWDFTTHGLHVCPSPHMGFMCPTHEAPHKVQ